MHMYMRKGDFVKGVTLGAILGGALGVLMAPKSGKETREEIMDKYQDIKKEFSREVSKMGELTREKYDAVANSIIAGYKEAKKITPLQAREISEIIDESYEKIEKAARKAMK